MPKKRKSTLKNAAPAPAERHNPFEELHSKKKFNVLGRRSKGEKAKPLKSRHAAVDKVELFYTCNMRVQYG